MSLSGNSAGGSYSPSSSPKWADALAIIGATLQDMDPRSRGGNVAKVSEDLARRRKQLDYQNSLSQLLGQVQPPSNIPITPRVPTTPTGMYDRVMGDQAGVNYSTPQQLGDYAQAKDALGASGPTYSGGLLSGQASQIAPILQSLPPDVSAPLLGEILKNAITPKDPILAHPGDVAFDPTGKQLFSVPEKQTFGNKGYGTNPATGKPDTYVLDNDGNPKWLGVTPQDASGFDLSPGQKRYDATGHLIASAPLVSDPNKPFNPDGTPNPAYQKYEQDLRVLGNRNASSTSPDAPDDPLISSWVNAVAAGNATMQQVPINHRDAVAVALSKAPKEIFAPTSISRYAMAANRIRNSYLNLPQYSLTANGLPYLQRIDAALKTPGSVSDQDLLDSLTKLNTAGNAVTDAQVKLITDGKSFSDWAGTLANKFQNGGVLSQNQRKQIQEIAQNIYANYKKGYQPVYNELTGKLKSSGIPEAFWGVPDLNNLSAQAMAPDSAPPPNAAPPTPSVGHPPNLPPGTLYSPSRRQYKTPDGRILDANGNPVQ